MAAVCRALKMAMNLRGIRCDAGWRWVLYIEF
jgi:hypothetical protein